MMLAGQEVEQRKAILWIGINDDAVSFPKSQVCFPHSSLSHCYCVCKIRVCVYIYSAKENVVFAIKF